MTRFLYQPEDIRQELDSNCVTFLTLLDHSKAFDSVNQNIHCTKLRNMSNFSTNATKFIRSYLTNRYQAVVSQTQVSTLRNLSRGVPHGSVLGNLLFSIYVNDIPSILSECEVHLYADDVQIYVSRPVTEIHACVRISNTILWLIEKWAKENGLGISPKKSKCFVIGKKQLLTLSLQKLYINHTQISYEVNAVNLGITFNNTLSWSNHIVKATGRTYALLRKFAFSISFLTEEVRLLIAKVILLPTLF